MSCRAAPQHLTAGTACMCVCRSTCVLFGVLALLGQGLGGHGLGGSGEGCSGRCALVSSQRGGVQVSATHAGASTKVCQHGWPLVASKQYDLAAGHAHQHMHRVML